MSNKKILAIILLLFSSSYCFSMVYDNRFFPLYKRPYSKKSWAPSRFATDFFVMAASEAISRKDDIIPIPRMFGEYYEDRLGKAITLLGKQNPLPDELQNVPLPWLIDGKIKATGLSFLWDQAIGKYVYVGGSWFFMSVHSFQEFCFDRQNATRIPHGYDIEEIRDAKCKMNNLIGITEQNYHEVGVGDIDFYVRGGKTWEYPFRFRQVDGGFRLGILIPTGKERNIDIPSSVPFGGNGHWGLYVQGDADFELKEDMRLGFMARFSKRFSKTCTKRLPLAKEHFLYGALRAPVKVDPGYNIVFSPYFSWEYLRKGFGVRVGYTLSYHNNDCWHDCRSAQEKEKCCVDLNDINIRSKWIQDYVDLYAFYDFGKVGEGSRVEPLVTLSWNAPVFIFAGHRVPKTHRISLGIEVNY